VRGETRREYRYEVSNLARFPQGKYRFRYTAAGEVLAIGMLDCDSSGGRLSIVALKIDIGRHRFHTGLLQQGRGTEAAKPLEACTAFPTTQD
jgi:hypothetical protein